ncbi:hypothetical protein BDZ85DRAFT_230095 [Elsinoe ampelina]|uniref:Uncharacterized protein n=1 Tax=Elsinoe ampelina TaxID=302913 RepID=A0A6A6GLQ2_9PEZI|nr:hypothetical protein BDZ85DRAFT_230095 [Elsinoe ampelina]
MGDAIHPTGPSQPTLNQAYTTPGNPADQEPLEKAQASRLAKDKTSAVDKRTDNDTAPIEEATFSSLGQGVRAPNAPGEEAQGKTHEDVGRHNELEAEQMAAPGEGKIAKAVDEKPGASGAQPGFESDLDRKKAEQAELRSQVKEERKQEVDVGGVLGQRGGPANPVDKGNYPNSGH